jgi:hypothetical protein
VGPALVGQAGLRVVIQPEPPVLGLRVKGEQSQAQGWPLTWPMVRTGPLQGSYLVSMLLNPPVIHESAVG